MRDLFGLTLSELQEFCHEEGFPRYAARQLCEWMYKKRVVNIDAMTNLSLKVRARIKETAVVRRTSPLESHLSSDGTRKYLFACADTDALTGMHNFVEAVYIPSSDRHTLCVSCQRGCKMGCRFCVTGQQGFHGNLTSGDILNQIFSVDESELLTNIVFMGMGEPLDNYVNIKRVLDILTADWGLGWSPTRLTVSSVGITPALKQLLDETKCHVAISLHNAFASERAELMPMQKAYPIAGIMDLLRNYNWNGQRRISFEYTMLRGINDDMSHAAELIRLIGKLHCRVNLIRFHASPNTPFRPSDYHTMESFRDYLSQHGVTCTIRASRGEDIMAACGLLAGAAQNR